MKKYNTIDLILHIMVSIAFLISFVLGYIIENREDWLINLSIALCSFMLSIYTGTKLHESKKKK